MSLKERQNKFFSQVKSSTISASGVRATYAWVGGMRTMYFEVSLCRSFVATELVALYATELVSIKAEPARTRSVLDVEGRKKRHIMQGSTRIGISDATLYPSPPILKTGNIILSIK